MHALYYLTLTLTWKLMPSAANSFGLDRTNMVAWDTCYRPTEMGGLGIIDLRLTGFTLQTRWLWLQKTNHEHGVSCQSGHVHKYKPSSKPQLPWWWATETTPCSRRIDGYTASASPTLPPCICHFVPARVRRQQTVRMGLLNRTWARCIEGGLSTQAIIDYLHLWHTVNGVQLNNEPDRTV